MAENSSDITVVTLQCPKCPRNFRTVAWIAYSMQPICPRCDVYMECVEMRDLPVLPQAEERERKIA
jgi:hypothetical protein